MAPVANFDLGPKVTNFEQTITPGDITVKDTSDQVLEDEASLAASYRNFTETSTFLFSHLEDKDEGNRAQAVKLGLLDAANKSPEVKKALLKGCLYGNFANSQYPYLAIPTEEIDNNRKYVLFFGIPRDTQPQDETLHEARTMKISFLTNPESNMQEILSSLINATRAGYRGDVDIPDMETGKLLHPKNNLMMKAAKEEWHKADFDKSEDAGNAWLEAFAS